MVELNLWAAWVGILLGMFSGSVQGLFFHSENGLGGYGSWARQMLRLGHMSFFGIAFLNFAYAATATQLDGAALNPAASRLFLLGAILMPAVCFLAAWKKPFRHAFFAPVLTLIAGVLALLNGGVWA